MSEAEEEIEGEEGSTGPAEVPMPSEVQLKLAEQGNYLATNLNALFATTMQLNADILAIREIIRNGHEKLSADCNKKMGFFSNRISIIEKERAEEKLIAEAEKNKALGLPVEEEDPLAKFIKIHAQLADLVRSNPSMISQACLKLEETIFALEPDSTAPPSEEKDFS
ncbi:uncharacterized protein [Physcomitrium patens]|uniref:uncharacterized protein n=1 Tax=Physcomitrium patens TaxID=3218 RepID=UPI0001620A2F|nr:uncharacterized protein LOC112291732 [Physcomitrium patens]XP_024395326.1 uncharacterized protein LOC112291732 [Physcomitrium patens]|eukprot:XP_024395325.1 uncharacterized protein LOC112291732 [Physcomitrella patens]